MKTKNFKTFFTEVSKKNIIAGLGQVKTDTINRAKEVKQGVFKIYLALSDNYEQPVDFVESLVRMRPDEPEGYVDVNLEDFVKPYPTDTEKELGTKYFKQIISMVTDESFPGDKIYDEDFILSRVKDEI